MQRRDRGLRATEIGGAELHAGSAEHERRRDRAPVADAAGGDHRHLHRLDDLLNQREGADLRGDIGLEEHAAMAAGLRPLRDDCIDAALGEPQGLAQRRGRADDFAARLPHTCEQLRLGQAEMEAHHVRLDLLDHATGRNRERHDGGLERDLGRLGAKLGIIRRELVEPGGVAFRIGRRHVMAEKIQVDRLLDARPERGNAFRDLLVGERGARIRSERACLGHGDGHVDAGRVRHRRLDDGKLDAKQFEQSCVRPGHREPSR